MARCGIKKYDKLPARIKSTDVDYYRYKLMMLNREIKLIDIKKKRIYGKLDSIIAKYNFGEPPKEEPPVDA